MNENPTREKILLLLKKRGALSIDDLSKELNITSMGIRQHLLSLERKGLIDYMTKRQGIGRPAFLYKLTEKADTLFPKTYDQFIVNLFRDVEKNEGREKIDEIFRWRRNRLLKNMKEAIADKKTIGERISGVKEVLESEGYLAELREIDSHFSLRVFNCPIPKLASEFKEACHYDLQILMDLFGKEASREECIVEGNPACTYRIPKMIPG